MEKQDYKLAIKLAIVDLIHNMNRDITFKLNAVIICVQLVMLIVSLMLQVITSEYKLGASLTNSLWSTAMLFVILINVKIISTKAMKKAKEQQNIIEVLLDKLTEDGSETDESHK